jgi:phosphatidylglycerol:prolipoprotein diacylglycerol transferase
MYPVLIKIGNYELRTYGVIVAIAAIVGILTALRYVRERGVDEDTFLNVVIWALIGGILGARVFWVFASPYLSTYLKRPLTIFAFWEGGLSFEGMVLGGLIAIFIASRFYKISLRKILDAGALGVSIGYGIGKFACFFNGCCYGLPVPSWWPKIFPFSLVFTNPKSQCDLLNTALYPAQLLNALSGWITFFALIYILRRDKNLYEGKLFTYFGYIFPPMLFAIEFIRYIPNRFLGLTPNQWFSIGFVIFAFLFDLYNRRTTSKTGAQEQ